MRMRVQRFQLFSSALVVALSLFSVLPTMSEAQAADEKPNIVYIVSDDLGWKDVGTTDRTSRRRTLTRLQRAAPSSSNSTLSRCARRRVPRS